MALSFPSKPFTDFMLWVTLVHVSLSNLPDTIGRKKSSSWFSPLWIFFLLFWMCLIGILHKYSGTRTDVNQEFVIMFTVVDENQSWYLEENIRHFCTDPDSVDKEDAVFQKSNKMHGECLSCYQVHTDCLLCIWHYTGYRTHRNIKPSFPRFITS